MGAGYTTSSPSNLDYMYQSPTNLMMKVIEQTDSNIDNTIGQYDILGNELAKVQHLPGDTQRVKEISDQYQNQIKGATTDITSNPMNYRKYMPQVRQLGRQIQTDMSSGELGAIQSNAAKYTQWQKDNQDRVNKGEISPDAYNAMKSYMLSSHNTTNYNAQTGNYNQLPTEDLYKDINVNQRVEKMVDGIMADNNVVSTQGPNGSWLVKTEKGIEQVDPTRIKDLVNNAAASDDELTGYLKQRHKIGLISNPQAELANATLAAIGKHAYSKTTNKQDMSINPVWEHQDSEAQTNARQTQQFEHADKMQQAGFEHEDQQSVEAQKDADTKFMRTLYEKNAETGGVYKDLIASIENGDTHGLRTYNEDTKIVNGQISIKDNANATLKDDTQNLSNFKQLLGNATKNGDIYNQVQAKSQLYNSQERINSVQRQVYQQMQSKDGYTEGETKLLNRYLHDPQGLKNEVVSGIQNETMQSTPEQIDYRWTTMKHRLDAMSSTFNDYAKDYYKKNIQTQQVNPISLSLNGPMADVKKQIYSYVANNPLQLRLVDPSTGKEASSVVNGIQSTLAKHPDTNLDEVMPVIRTFNHGGSKLEVQVGGKRYIADFRGNTNIDNVISTGLSRYVGTNPEVKAYVDELNDNYRTAALYDIDQLTPGKSYVSTFKMGDPSTGGVESHPIQISTTMNHDGSYKATFVNPTNGQTKELFGSDSNPLTREELAAKISQFVNNQVGYSGKPIKN